MDVIWYLLQAIPVFFKLSQGYKASASLLETKPLAA